jgi:hypothetical protein
VLGVETVQWTLEPALVRPGTLEIDDSSGVLVAKGFQGLDQFWGFFHLRSALRFLDLMLLFLDLGS